jgi:hypothetical protein
LHFVWNFRQVIFQQVRIISARKGILKRIVLISDARYRMRATPHDRFVVSVTFDLRGAGYIVSERCYPFFWKQVIILNSTRLPSIQNANLDTSQLLIAKPTPPRGKPLQLLKMELILIVVLLRNQNFLNHAITLPGIYSAYITALWNCRSMQCNTICCTI